MTQDLTHIELGLTQRLLALAEDCAARGLPPDLVVRALLGAGLAFARRFDSGASIALQLEPVLEALADDDAGPARPVWQ